MAAVESAREKLSFGVTPVKCDDESVSMTHNDAVEVHSVIGVFVAHCGHCDVLWRQIFDSVSRDGFVFRFKINCCLPQNHVLLPNVQTCRGINIR